MPVKAAVPVLRQAERIYGPYLPGPKREHARHQPSGRKMSAVAPGGDHPVALASDEQPVSVLFDRLAVNRSAVTITEFVQAIKIGRRRETKDDIPDVVGYRWASEFRPVDDDIARTIDETFEHCSNRRRKAASAEIAPALRENTAMAHW